MKLTKYIYKFALSIFSELLPNKPKLNTVLKGRPTPKQRQSIRSRKLIIPAPKSTSEARRRRKKMSGSKISKEERKVVRNASRANIIDRRKKMMAGEEAYLMPRDKGLVKRYVRNLVDSRCNILGLFMPSTLIMIILTMALPSLKFQQILSYTMSVLIILMTTDGFILGYKINQMVDKRFPNSKENSWKLGFYAASRASQLRRMRIPKPMVKYGEKVY